MSLSNTDSITAVMISAVGQTTFTYTFPILVGREADLEVTVDGVIQTLTTDYSVTGAGNASGGTVIFVVALVGGEEVVIRRVSQFTQATVYTETGAFPAASHEAALDKLTMITQELKEVDERALKWAPKVDKTVVSAELPDPTNNAGKGMFFSAGGVVAQTISSTDIKNALENCACLGRDAYGKYIDNMTASLMSKINA